MDIIQAVDYATGARLNCEPVGKRTQSAGAEANAFARPLSRTFSKSNPMTDTAKTELVDIDLTVIYLMARYDGASREEAEQAVIDYLEARGL